VHDRKLLSLALPSTLILTSLFMLVRNRIEWAVRRDRPAGSARANPPPRR